eukprot:s153_g61.t1
MPVIAVIVGCFSCEESAVERTLPQVRESKPKKLRTKDFFHSSRSWKAGTQYSMGELLRMVEDEEQKDDIDPQQLWMLSTHMKSERGGDWHMARASSPELPAKKVGGAQKLLQFLDKSSVPLHNVAEEMMVEGHQPGRQGLKGTKLLEVS